MPNSTVFMGSVGSDRYAEIIVQKANEIGLKTLFQTTDKESTATCAVLLTDSNRSMVAHLGAAYHFTENFLEFPKNWSIVENSRLFYITV
jgi:adenosine kinase